MAGRILRHGGDSLAHRFPLPSALVVLAAGLSILAILDVPVLDGGRLDGHLLAGAFLCSLAALAGALLAEGRGWSRRSGLLAGGALAALVAARHVFADPEDPSTPLLLAPGLVLLCSAAPFTRAGDRQYWCAHLSAVLGAAIALASGLVLAGGLTALGLALESLFGVDVPDRYYRLSRTLGLLLLAPLALLAALPAHTLVLEPPRWLRRAALWLLLPLATAYLLVAYGYGLSILVEWELPRGRVAPVMGGFAAFAVAVYAILHPWHFQRPWMAKAVFALLAAPLALLAAAVHRRIADYGVTEERALLVAVAVWLAAMIAAHLAGRPRLPLLDSSLGLLLAAASFGPWGAYALSASSQMARLTAILEDHGRLQDGRLVPSELEVPPRAANEIHSLLLYLDRTGKWDAAARLAPEASIERDERIASLTEAGGIPGPTAWTDASGLRGFFFEEPELIDAGGYSLVAAVSLWPRDTRRLRAPGGAVYEVEIQRQAGQLRLSAEDGRSVEFDMRGMLEAALADGGAGAQPTGEAADSTGSLRVRLALQEAAGRIEADGPDLHGALLLILIADEAG